MTLEQIKTIANKCNGIVGDGKLNWMGDYNMELKKNQFSIFFRTYNEAKKGIKTIPELNCKIIKTPKFVNEYFKYSILITIN